MDEIQKNQARIAELATSMSVWGASLHAQNPVVRAKVLEIQNETLARLEALEQEGQTIKIANMERVIDLLKNGV